MDAVFPACAEILGDKRRKCIAKILNRHVGKRVNLHSHRERRHHGGTEAVDQSLYHQDSKIHDGLLDTRQHRKSGNLF